METHLEAVRLPGKRIMGPLLSARLAPAGELRRFERRAQERARDTG